MWKTNWQTTSRVTKTKVSFVLLPLNGRPRSEEYNCCEVQQPGTPPFSPDSWALTYCAQVMLLHVYIRIQLSVAKKKLNDGMVLRLSFWCMEIDQFCKIDQFYFKRTIGNAEPISTSLLKYRPYLGLVTFCVNVTSPDHVSPPPLKFLAPLQYKIRCNHIFIVSEKRW